MGNIANQLLIEKLYQFKNNLKNKMAENEKKSASDQKNPPKKK